MNKPLKFIHLILLTLLFTAAAFSQDARLNFDRLSGLDARARDVVEVNIDGNLLDLAKRVTAKVEDANARKAARAIEGLKGIYVRVYRFQNENEYNIADVDEIRSQLTAPGWEKVANVRSKRNNQKVDVYTMFTEGVMSGLAVVISESKSVAVVNMIGPVDIEMLVEISGRLNIPKIDIEREPSTPVQPKEEE